MSRQALLVLGMHRSGTSAVTGLLMRLGVQGPRTLMPPDVGNPEGYGESALLCEFHDRLLAIAGSRWDSYAHLDPDRLWALATTSLLDECRSLLRAEFGDAPRFVLKDPRVCRLVPLWDRLLRGEDILPAAVLVLRSPLEVAQSLNVRNEFERDLSLLVWLRHVLDAEHDSRGMRRSVVRYRDVLDDWRLAAGRIARDLDWGWPARSEAQGADIDRFVQASLRHHHQGGDALDASPVLSAWVRRAGDAMELLADGAPARAAEATKSLDVLRQEFDELTAVFGEIRDRAYDNLRQEVQPLQRQVEVLEAARARLQARIEALDQEAGALRAALSAAREDADALRQSMSWRITAPLRAAYRWLR